MSAQVILDDAVWQDVEPGTEALVEDWLVAEGATVAAGQAIASVVVVKASHEVTAPAAGILAQVLVAAGDTFARGAALAVIEPA